MLKLWKTKVNMLKMNATWLIMKVIWKSLKKMLLLVKVILKKVLLLVKVISKKVLVKVILKK